MLISTKVNFDLLKLSHPAVINAMQGDKNTRRIEARLYSDGYPWTDTSGLTAAVAFKKPDGTSGIYDRLPNGTSAVTVSKDTITAILAQQMLTVPGKVNAAILLSDASQQNQISTFPFHVHVEANPAAEAAASDDYYNYTSWEELNNAADAWFAEQDKKIAETLEGIRRVSAPSIVEPARGEVITVSDASDLPLAGLKVFGKTEQNGIPTPDAPVPLESVGDSVTVTVCGKNLLKNTLATTSISGVTCTDNQDGTYTLSGTAGAEAIFWVNRGQELKKGVYRVLGGPKGDSYNTYHIGGLLGNTLHDGRTVDFSGGSANIAIVVKSGVNCNNVLFKPMITLDLSATYDDFEPYKDGGSVTVTPVDSSGKSLYLPGIPVTSGGNYTDPATKQQWICDEVDFEKNVYVQRIGNVQYGSITTAPGLNGTSISERKRLIISDDAKPVATSNTIAPILCSVISPGTAGDTWNCVECICVSVGGSIMLYLDELSSMTANDVLAWLNAKQASIQYILAEEKHIPLSEIDPDALAQFASLHSNYPNTTVFNDKNAGMEVKYVADTKLYIDKKFNELAAALVSKV